MSTDYFINNHVSQGIRDKRIGRLIKRVWKRIPAYDRAVLREFIISISDEGDEPEHILGMVMPSDTSGVWDGNAGDAAIDNSAIVYFTHAKDIKSDDACMAVIAHEFAHVVLRHYQYGAVVGGLINFNPPIYTKDQLNQQEDYEEDAAYLQVWIWGFKDELRTLLKEHSPTRQPRWLGEIS